MTFTPTATCSQFKRLSTVPSSSTYFSKALVQSRSSVVRYSFSSRNPPFHSPALAATLEQGIPALLDAYNKRFEVALPYPADYPAEKRKSLETFSKAVTSNLIGGIGYFYGNSIVDKKFSYEWDEDEDSPLGDGESGARLTEPKALLTATPSRSFFPRGFYWYVYHIGCVWYSPVKCPLGMKVSICFTLDSMTTT